MIIGYARKSTHIQDMAHQVDELNKAGCEQVYQEQTSRGGPKRDAKGTPELDNCLKALRAGDTLVVWALDRLGGSLGQVIALLDDLKKREITFIAIKDRINTSDPVIGEIYTHLMAIFSNFERNRIIERTRSGLAAARARGRVGGRKPSLSEDDIKQMKILLADPEMTVGAVAKRFNVSRMTIYRYTNSDNALADEAGKE
ncbi:TPA: recombinase family protein [Escherichia coli]|uniref:recombinase family protein n=1 Tax=Enterobacteriaceae TaxID=543 RepID=UPI0006642991|nr:MULTISPECIES: recombinase family protein [Enterobacteriaceae]HAO9775439.1 recombinase family protein [Escherichia coli O25b:H4-ST131]EFZ1484186.1 recombinase family protein [Shigella sonnei]CSE55765.1 inversion of adjacent DNA%3B at locus of e14 element [Shigella sonnei]SLY50610.1 Resolvase-like protein [Klebsiella pneumoniae]SLY75809.1 Resolvase-like protein [Klebsiella pneumoniae]